MLLHLLARETGLTAVRETERAGGLVMPTTVEAASALMAGGHRFVAGSDHLEPADYHDVWERATRLVWSVLSSAPDDECPSLPRILAYDCFLFTAQAMAVQRVLDRLHEAHGLSKIILDAAGGPTPGESVHFEDCEGLYELVASAWAPTRGVALESRAAPALPAARTAPIAWSATLRRLAYDLRRLSWVGRSGLAAVRHARRSGRAVFYVPYLCAGLSEADAPAWAVPVGVLLDLARAMPVRPRIAAADTRSRLAGLAASWGDLSSLLLSRLVRWYEHNSRQGELLHRWFTRVLDRCRRRDIEAAFVAFAPYGPSLVGYVSEAFRRLGQARVAVQHGGNYRRFLRSGDGHLFSDYQADLFLEWGSAGIFEHETYRIDHRIPCRSVGAPLSAHLVDVLRREAPAPDPGRKVRVLYVPTVLSTASVHGSNAPWDRYLSLLVDALALLDSPAIECVVKALPGTGARLPRREFRHLRLIEQGRFADFVPDSDVCVVDSVGGSPLWEVTYSRKPVVAYLGAEASVLEPRAAEALARRVRLCACRSEFLEQIGMLVAEPVPYVQALAALSGDTAFVDLCQPPTQAATLWQTLADRLTPQ